MLHMPFTGTGAEVNSEGTRQAALWAVRLFRRCNDGQKQSAKGPSMTASDAARERKRERGGRGKREGSRPFNSLSHAPPLSSPSPLTHNNAPCSPSPAYPSPRSTHACGGRHVLGRAEEAVRLQPALLVVVRKGQPARIAALAVAPRRALQPHRRHGTRAGGGKGSRRSARAPKQEAEEKERKTAGAQTKPQTGRRSTAKVPPLAAVTARIVQRTAAARALRILHTPVLHKAPQERPGKPQSRPAGVAKERGASRFCACGLLPDEAADGRRTWACKALPPPLSPAPLSSLFRSLAAACLLCARTPPLRPPAWARRRATRERSST